jgi:hypothetical protein
MGPGKEEAYTPPHGPRIPYLAYLCTLAREKFRRISAKPHPHRARTACKVVNKRKAGPPILGGGVQVAPGSTDRIVAPRRTRKAGGYAANERVFT